MFFFVIIIIFLDDEKNTVDLRRYLSATCTVKLHFAGARDTDCLRMRLWPRLPSAASKTPSRDLKKATCKLPIYSACIEKGT